MLPKYKYTQHTIENDGAFWQATKSNYKKLSDPINTTTSANICKKIFA